MKNLVLAVLLVAALLGSAYYIFVVEFQPSVSVASAKPSATPVAGPVSAPASAPAAPVAAASAAAPSSGLVKCPHCDGSGMVKCPNLSCDKGTVECTGSCLRPDKGEWVKMDVAGHPPTDVWQIFRYRTANGNSYQAWNQHHYGDVIEYVDGKPTNMGPCQICHGTTRMPCPTCLGSEKIICPVCHGTKVIDPKKTAQVR